MLSLNVQDFGEGLELLLPLLLCCMMPMMFQRGGGQQQTSAEESDTWYVNYGIQEAYDLIVKETDAWRENAVSKRKKNRFAFLSRKEPEIFVVDDAVPMRLYRIKDDQVGEITFELTETMDGGTSIKTTYNTPARKTLQNFKAKLPTKVLSIQQNNCPSCGKEVMPDYTTCPYCGEKLGTS